MAVSPQELLSRAEALRNGNGRRERHASFLFHGLGQRRPDATPADGVDHYGNPNPEWLQIDWREHLRSVDVDGAEVNYVEIGEGPTLVLVHGLSGCWQNWLEQIPYFSRTHRVLALDLPGFGDSPMPPWDISIPRYGELLDGFCRELNVHSSTLVGNSMGGFISAEASIAQPDWVEKLVLVSAAGITHARMRKEPAAMAARMATAVAPLALRFQDSSLLRPRMRWAAFRGVFHAPHRIRPELLWEQYHGAMDAPGFADSLQTLIGYDFTDRLESVEDPTLIVWGRNDRVVPPGDAAGYAKHLRNSRVVIFDRCGHCPMLERPLRFNRVLEEFLEAGLEGDGGELAQAADAPASGRAPEAETVD